MYISLVRGNWGIGNLAGFQRQRSQSHTCIRECCKYQSSALDITRSGVPVVSRHGGDWLSVNTYRSHEYNPSNITHPICSFFPPFIPSFLLQAPSPPSISTSLSIHRRNHIHRLVQQDHPPLVIPLACLPTRLPEQTLETGTNCIVVAPCIPALDSMPVLVHRRQYVCMYVCIHPHTWLLFLAVSMQGLAVVHAR